MVYCRMESVESRKKNEVQFFERSLFNEQFSNSINYTTPRSGVLVQDCPPNFVENQRVDSERNVLEQHNRLCLGNRRKSAPVDKCFNKHP